MIYFNHITVNVEACGVIIVLGNGLDDPSSNPGQGCLNFT